VNKRGDAQQYIRTQKNKKEILQELENSQQDRIQIKIEENPIIKLGKIKPEGIVLELKMREIE
jgi:hypothetical protein